MLINFSNYLKIIGILFNKSLFDKIKFDALFLCLCKTFLIIVGKYFVIFAWSYKLIPLLLLMK